MKRKIKEMCGKGNSCGCGCSGVYCLGFLGAAVYYITNATSFFGGVWGVIKALVWPAFLIFKFFSYFQI